MCRDRFKPRQEITYRAPRSLLSSRSARRAVGPLQNVSHVFFFVVSIRTSGGPVSLRCFPQSTDDRSARLIQARLFNSLNLHNFGIVDCYLHHPKLERFDLRTQHPQPFGQNLGCLGSPATFVLLSVVSHKEYWNSSHKQQYVNNYTVDCAFALPSCIVNNLS
jgi:hypothetical protein